MHATSANLMTVLLKKYGVSGPLQVLDVGSGISGKTTYPNGPFPPGMQQLTGHLCWILHPEWAYHGLDIELAPNVEIVAPDPYHWPVEDNSYDLVVSAQTMEHVPEVQLWMNEIFRVCKPEGIVIIIAPSAGAFHRCPVHCWCIMPDGMEYSMRCAGFDILEVGFMAFGNPFNDCWGVAKKPTVPNTETQSEIYQKLRIKPLNEILGWSWDKYSDTNPVINTRQ